MLAMLGVVLVGAVVVALLLTRVKSKPSSFPTPDAFRNLAATDVINMAHIRVAGVGGLGLVVVALVTGLDIPEIGQSVVLGLILGIVFAFALIAWRRRRGPMPSSGGQMGANTMLSIDTPRPSDDSRTPPSVSSQIVTAPAR